MKVGVSLPTNGPLASPEALRAVAVECERLGYDSIWASDHTSWTPSDARQNFPVGSVEAWQGPVEPNYFEPLITMAHLAASTRRIGLGLAVVVLPLRNPVLLAKQVACLDQLAGGRLVLTAGIGGGIYAEAEARAVGMSDLPRRRGRVADEWIDVMRCVWSQPSCSFQGRFIHVEDAQVYPKPVQQPFPVWIGGESEAAMKRAALRGNAWLQSRLSPANIAPARQRLGELARAAGRDPSSIQIGGYNWLSISQNRADAEARAAETMRELAQAFKDTRPDAPPAAHVPNFRFIGDPETILPRVAAYREAGFDHLVLRVIAHNLPQLLDSLRLFKEQVLDRFPPPRA